MILSTLGLLPAEEKEQVKHIEAIMNGQFTQEGVCDMYMQCNRDLDLTTQRLLSLGFTHLHVIYPMFWFLFILRGIAIF